VAAAVALLQNTEELKGAEGLRQQVTKFLASIPEMVTAEVAAKEASVA
jgi:hypothetical protein